MAVDQQMVQNIVAEVMRRMNQNQQDQQRRQQDEEQRRQQEIMQRSRDVSGQFGQQPFNQQQLVQNIVEEVMRRLQQGGGIQKQYSAGQQRRRMEPPERLPFEHAREKRDMRDKTDWRERADEVKIQEGREDEGEEYLAKKTRFDEKGDIGFRGTGSPSFEVQRALKGMDYPAEKDEVIQYAIDNGAPQEVINVMDADLADRRYYNAADVSQQFKGERGNIYKGPTAKERGDKEVRPIGHDNRGGYGGQQYSEPETFQQPSRAQQSEQDIMNIVKAVLAQMQGGK